MQQIEDMLARGVAFSRIERHIEQRDDLSADAKNALWLLAWVKADRDERRGVVRELLASLPS